ncbi:hypothetical protein BaRGS_00010349, partial [Batillaria attramentaria]
TSAPSNRVKCREAEELDGFVDFEPGQDIVAGNGQADCDVDDAVTGAEEGDMLLNEDGLTGKKETDDDDSAAEGELRPQERKIVSSASSLWPDAVIPYSFNTGNRRFANIESRKAVEAAMAQWETSTCVRFVERGTAAFAAARVKHGAFLDIGGGPGCAASVGYRGERPYRVYLNEEKCMLHFALDVLLVWDTELGTIIHELGHAIGFFHEQARADRNNYVTVHDENVRNEYEANFRTSPLASDAEKYDLSSVMHYGPKSFSKNGQDTLTAKDPFLQFLLGRRSHLSFYDIKLANEAYKCAGNCRTEKPRKCSHDGVLLRNCTCLCPYGLGGDTCDDVDSKVSPGCGSVIRIQPGEESSKDTVLTASVEIQLDPDKATGKCASWLELRYSYIGQDGP